MKNILKKAPSTENALKGINAAIAELDAVVEAENAEIARQDVIIRDAQSK